MIRMVLVDAPPGTHPSRKVEPPRGLDGELPANHPSYAEPPHPKI